MSHPWKAQPYYLYRETRTTGMVPAPMGAFEVRAALSGFTRGSFASRSPWATPKYVSSVPDGVAGFCGFGSAEGCMRVEDAAKKALPVVQQVLRQLRDETIGGYDIGAMLASLADREDLLLVALTRAIDASVTSAQALTKWLARFFKSVASSVWSTVTGAAGFRMLAEGESGSIPGVVDMALNNLPDRGGAWNYLANRVGTTVWGSWPANICTTAAGAPTVPTQITQAQLWELQRRMAAQAAQVAPGSAVAKATTAPTAIQLFAPTPAALPPDEAAIEPAAAGGISPFVIAAGAVAALLLLK